MSTAPHIVERNQANAKKSTGPATPEGKRIVSQNARRLGIFISDATLEQEESQDLADIFTGYIADYVPEGAVEHELVRQLAIATHRLRRLERIETAVLWSDEIALTRHDAGAILGSQFKFNSTALDQIQRGRTAAERTFHRVYKELEARKQRRWTPRTPPEVVEICIDTRHDPRPKRPVAAPVSNELQNKASAAAATPLAKPSPDPLATPATPEHSSPQSQPLPAPRKPRDTSPDR